MLLKMVTRYGFGMLATLSVAACSGEDGEAGEDGSPGDAGLPGQDGEQGEEGEQGEQGEEGEQGEPGEDGEQGEPGEDGADGDAGLSSLITQTPVFSGDETCFSGGVRIDSGQDADRDGELSDDEITETSHLCNPTTINTSKNFNRVTSFLVCSQIEANCNDDTETAAEIVAASEDGMTLIYSDSPQEVIGFVDITDPETPVAAGTVALGGEPTSVAVQGDYALVGVNTSADFINVSGELAVIDIANQTITATLDLGGQPDSVAVSPDGTYAAIVIENERDEDLEEGVIPQLPAGKLVVVALDGQPDSWSTTDIDLTGLDGVLEPTDPEPEYVDINDDNIAVVSLQENNAVVLVDLAAGTVLNSFSAGEVDLTMVDDTEEGALISQTASISDIPREPDGVTWLGTDYFATADEGDMDGGSRGFTVFNTDGDVVWTSGNTMEHLTARFGHYPDERSENKGNEPENAEFGVYGTERYLFVNSERSSLVFVYDVADFTRPVFKQVLPAGVGPEGALAIPSRNLLVVASEEDARADKIRSVLNIYSYGTAPAQYPTLVSADRINGTPIPWSAMSGLVAHPTDPNTLYGIEDSFYLSNRIFQIDTSTTPARVVDEIQITDGNGALAATAAEALADDTVDATDVTRKDVFDVADLAALINDDGTVNIDPEGIAVASDGGFWLVSEGSGTASDTDNFPINSLNFLFKLDADGVIEEAIRLPDEVNANQLRFGFEGVTEADGKAYVAFQRVWTDIPGDVNVRIGIYDTTTETWEFAYYPLDAAESQNGGWVGLSDLTALGDGEFLVLERDNQGGPDAAVKRLYQINLDAAVLGDPTQPVTKTLVRDLMPDLAAPGGLTYEKIEGLAVSVDGSVWIANDNDGVDDNSGETQLLNLGSLL